MLINDEQPWFKIIHFTNHQLELAIADAFKESDAFQKNWWNCILDMAVL